MKNQMQPKLLAGLTLVLGFVLSAGLAAGATTHYVALSGAAPNGGRINMGAYGNTPVASMYPWRGTLIRIQ